MTSTAIKSQSSTIGIGDAASPEVYTTIANVTSIALTGGQAPDIDVTDLSSTAKEFLQGLEDPGNIELTGFYDQTNAQHQSIRDDLGTNNAKNYKITLSDAETIVASCRVAAWNSNIAVDGAVEYSATLKISGSITYSN